MRKLHAITSIHFHGGNHDKITPPSGIKLLTIAVLAALSSTCFAAQEFPTDGTTVKLSGDYSLAPTTEVTLAEGEYLGNFQIDGNAPVNLFLNSNTVFNAINNAPGASLFLNTTDKAFSIDGNGHALTLNHNNKNGGFGYGEVEGSATLAGKNIHLNNLSALTIDTKVDGQYNENYYHPGAALLINGKSSISLSEASSNANNARTVSIKMSSEDQTTRLYALGLSGGELSITNADMVNIELAMNKHQGNNKSYASAGIGFISLNTDFTTNRVTNSTSESTVFDAGDAVVNVVVSRNTGHAEMAGISYQNYDDKKLIQNATVKAKELVVNVTDNTPNGAYGGANGLYIVNQKTTSPTITIDAETATFNVYTEDGHAKGLSSNSFYGNAADIIFTGDTTFNVTSNSSRKDIYAYGIDMLGLKKGSTLTFQKDVKIVAKGKASAQGVYLPNQSEIIFGGNTSITAQALEGANPEGTVAAIKNNGGGSIRMGVDAEGQLNGKTVEINGDILNEESNLTIGLSGSESTMTSQVTDSFAKGENTPRMRLLMADNATWVAKGSSTVGTIEADNATIDLSQTGSTVAINDLTVTDQGLNVFVNEVSEEPRVTVAAKSGDGRIAVTGSDTLNDSYGNVDDMIRALSQVVQENGTGTEGTSLVDTVTAEEGSIRGEVTSTLEDGQWQTTVKPNVSLEGYSALSSLAAVNWRHEMNDVTKRMGELRDSTGKAGAWARAYGSELEYGAQNVTSKNTSIQVGADYALTDEWKMGAAFSYTDGSMTFDRGDGDNQAYGLAIYGTWMAENGLFVDLIGKYSRLETEFTSNKLEGEFDNNGWSFSAEAGWQFKPIDEAFVEPQVELTYGRLEGDAFHGSNGVNIVQDDFDSLIGRAGVRAGFFFPEKKGTIYAKASVAHDFKGDMESFAYLDEPYTPTATLKDELGGTWYEFGLGANFNWSETTYAYVDLQRTTAGNVNEAWRWNIGVRHAF